MRPQDIITKKRDGERLSAEEINEFILGVTEETWADYQISALIMAMFIHELDAREQSSITQAMLHSGEVLDFSDIDKPKADKHSTGGVGDKTSLIIAPLLAACDVAVPMISGRGLGHTGGTLDKLESIEGFNVNLSTSDFKRIVKQCGYAMTGQTAEIVPADKKMYALRDATATVPTIPLIVASIMSKKLAEGLDSLVLDVKTGNGAFMSELEEAKLLAEAMTQTGNSCGVKTTTLITDMNQPLGKFVGNSHEVYECVKILRSEIDEASQPLLDLARELSAHVLVMTAVSETRDAAKNLLNEKLSSGEALEKFRQNVELQGGDAKVCDDPETLLENGLFKTAIKTELAGFLSEINTKEIGNAVCEIGGGRLKAEDKVDHGVGYASDVKLGYEIKSGEVLGVLYSGNETQANLISEKLQNAYKITNEPPKKISLVKEVIR